MMRVDTLTVVGARPQFIKAAPVSRALATQQIREVLVHTGQHFDEKMSDIFFEELEMTPPDYNLGINQLSHGAMTARMLEALEKLMLQLKPTTVLVYGDTNSTLAGALAASKLHIPVAHVEAGIRSFNKRMPEELNRILTDHMSSLLFTPTDVASGNLSREGIAENKIRYVGDVMYDAAIYYRHKAEAEGEILSYLGLEKREYILATVHRAENTDDPKALANIFSGLSTIAAQVTVLLPLHPRTRKQLSRYDIDTGNIRIIEPIGYLDMISLEANAMAIVTDSGGVQKEAYFYRVPCVTLREETEWVELVENNWNVLVSPFTETDIADIVMNRCNIQGQPVQLYGGGNASDLVANQLKALLECN